MAAAGLIDRTPDKPRLCIAGRIVTGEELSRSGDKLPDSDIAWVAEQVAVGKTKSWLGQRLSDPFNVNAQTVVKHLDGGCLCPPETPLRGVCA